MGNLAFEIVLIAFLIILNGLFSMTEIAVVSARRIRLAGAAAEGSAGAERAIFLQENPDRFLSTVQIGITLVGILSGAIGGAMLSDEFSALVAQIPVLQPYADKIGFGIIIAIITFFSLVVGELVPKNLALNMPERIDTIFSRPMHIISIITAPAVWLLSRSTTLLLKVFGISEAADHGITEEELRAHIAHGAELGVLEKTEKDLIESVIRLDDQRIGSIMTSRTKIERIDLNDGLETQRRKLISAKHSHLPVCCGSLDDVIGIVRAGDILAQLLENGTIDVEGAMKEPLFVPETLTALELIGHFRKSDTHIALIVDEFGSVEGIVTMSDVMEAIVGEVEMSELSERSVVVREDGSFLLSGSLSAAEFREILGMKAASAEERGAYETLGGFVLFRLEKVPTEADTFVWDNYIFEVVDMDGRRVDKVLVTKRPDHV